MLKKLFFILIFTNPILFLSEAYAVSTGIELSSVDIPMDGATISLPGYTDIPIEKSPDCVEGSDDCPTLSYSYYFDTDNLLEENDMGTAVIKTEDGETYATFTRHPFGGLTLTDVVVRRNKVSSWIDPLFYEHKLKYDDLGRVISSTDEAKLTTRYAYDDMNHRISKIDPTGTETGYEYDGLGRKIAEFGDSGRTTFDYSYDTYGNITRTLNDETGATLQQYDGFGRLVSQTDPSGTETTYEYDIANRSITKTSTDGSASRSLYNAAGQKITETAINTDWSPYDPVEVGRKSKVGTESLGSKVVKAAAGKIIGSLLGGFGGSRKAKKPKTKRDPARRADKSELYDEATDTKLEIRPNWVDNKLHVSAYIKDSDDKATFQYIYLVDEAGNVLGPETVELYKIWVKHTLTVSWTESTYVDGALVSQTSGGWTESWVEDLGTFRAGQNPLSDIPGIWQTFGYDRAHAGARGVGATFNIDPTTFDQLGQLNLVTHVTQPKLDPVSTIPFVGQLFKNGDKDFRVEPIILVTPRIVDVEEN